MMTSTAIPTPKMNIFRSTGFISKLFIQLTKEAIDPIIVCVQILKLHSKNRTKEEMELILPFLSEYPNLNHLLMSDESSIDSKEIIRQFAQISFFKYSPKHSIIRRPNEKQNWFFFILNGSIAVLAVKFEKLGLSKDEYLTYLIKLKLLGEENMLTQCMRLNKSIIDIDEYSLESVSKIRYEVYESRARAEIIAYRQSSHFNLSIVSSLKDYIQITYPSKNNGLVDKEAKIMFTIPNYEQVNTLNSGDFFGSLIPLETNSVMYQEKDFHTYVALCDCDLTYINVKENQLDSLFTTMKNKIKRTCFKDIISRFCIFQSIERIKFEENYAKLFSLRFVKRGEKIILQDSLNGGVFLLLKGSFEVSTKRSYNEIDALILKLKQSLEGSNDFISDLTSKDEGDKQNRRIAHPRYQSDNYSGLFQEKRVIKLNQVSSKEVFGLNDCFDYKTKMNHFTIECTSATGDLLFLQRDAFLYLFYKESSVQTLLSRIIENKVEFYLETLKRYKDKFNLEAGMLNSNTIVNTKILPYNNYYQTIVLGETNQPSHKRKKRSIFLNKPNAQYDLTKRTSIDVSFSTSEVNLSKNYSIKSRSSNKLPTIIFNSTGNKVINVEKSQQILSTQTKLGLKNSSLVLNELKVLNKKATRRTGSNN